MTDREWAAEAPTLTLRDLARIYRLSERGVRRKVEKAAEDIPRPDFLHPYRWKREKVRQHYDGHSVLEQRRALARAKRQPLQAVS